MCKTSFASPLFRREPTLSSWAAPGLGKSHLATALAYEACLAGHTVLFTTAIDIVNTLAAAQSTHRLKAELRKYTQPERRVNRRARLSTYR